MLTDVAIRIVGVRIVATAQQHCLLDMAVRSVDIVDRRRSGTNYGMSMYLSAEIKYKSPPAIVYAA
jgi:hypothetical protein